MKRFNIIILLVLSFSFWVSNFSVGRADVPQTLIINEVQTGSSLSASEEFIELINTSEDEVNLKDWKVEYYSAASVNFNSPSRTIGLSGSVQAGKQLLLATTDYLSEEANFHYSATLAKTGGHIRLVSPDPANPSNLIVHDLLGWGTASMPETAAATPPSDGSSLQRKVDENGKTIDTNNNADDFDLNTVPTPQGDDQPEPTTLPDPIPDPNPSQLPEEQTDTDDVEVIASEFLPIKLSELFPNPASPQTDAEHEYIELFNPNNEDVDLDGYQLQTGNTFAYSFTFQNETIAAKAYKAFYVTQTDTLLANSGGKARLLDPLGKVQDETRYETADDGEVWALIEGIWQWSTTATPNAPNILKTPVVLAKSTKLKASKAKTAKSKSTKSAAKAKLASATTSVNRDVFEEPESVQIQPINTTVLAVVGVLTIGYAAYEYRQDMSNFVYRVRKHREYRRKTG